ncbi:MAG TPA: saccharopine dehydrogenase C-terminal domain-containing protein [Puia sp.]|nr:saccharopine dehydrogenase C-terminal domain-containing protein [Puia sp.]
MKKILLFGAGKSATCLIDYLIMESGLHDWELTVADGNLSLAQSKTRQAARTRAVSVDVQQDEARKKLVDSADMVISLLPPSLHHLVARDCIEFGKHLLNASYVDDQTRKLENTIREKGLLFLCEMGLDPGLDHMSAMQLIHRVRARGAVIHSFRSHTGGLVAPESDDNPWHYKISWNPRNVVTAGKAGAVYREEGVVKKKKYHEIFEDCGQVTVNGSGSFAWYPNRDSLGYLSLYGMEDVVTFIRTTLRHPDFCAGWKAIVAAGLTDDQQPLQTAGLSFRQWSLPLLPFVNDNNRTQLSYLGLFDDQPVPASASNAADILQFLLETKLPMHPHDKDMIVMLHELGLSEGARHYRLASSLVVKGEDHLHTAMARTVGLPLGIAAKLVLENKIKLTGLHIPILPEIYEPVMRELEKEGISFREELA